MTPNRLITLAIHTYEKALPLKNLLEREGVYVELNNVNLSSPVVSPGVRIRILESDLPLALRIVENYEIFAIPECVAKGKSGHLLVPVDFTEHSFNAVATATALARRLKCEVEFVHAYITPTHRGAVQLSPTYDYLATDLEMSRRLQAEAEEMMAQFTARVKAGMKSGEIAPVKFTTAVVEGLPEDVILAYVAENKPQAVVMGTRAASKKETDMVGSVTAEVLDSCTIPAFTVPENVAAPNFNSLSRVAFFCNLDQEDMLALDVLFRIFPDLNLKVELVYVEQRRLIHALPSRSGARDNLMKYCRERYPNYEFTFREIKSSEISRAFNSPSGDQRPFELLCLPDRHKNLVARVFNPGMAHKILFRADIPMLVVPV